MHQERTLGLVVEMLSGMFAHLMVPGLPPWLYSRLTLDSRFQLMCAFGTAGQVTQKLRLTSQQAASAWVSSYVFGHRGSESVDKCSLPSKYSKIHF